jgi:nucleoid-associated protein YgaU
MSAATIHRPSIPTQRGLQPPQLRLVPAGERAARVRSGPVEVPALRLSPAPAPARAASVQLTRRGRLVILVALVGVGIGLMLALTGVFGSATAGSAPSRPATRTIVVQPGQTLWSIAKQVAPNADRRDTIARIVELNALPNSSVSAGARIAVPTR